MGTGILSLPFAASRLGWGFALGSCVGFALCANYSGRLLARIRNDSFPTAESYTDVARLTCGPVFGGVTRVAICLNWSLLLPYYMLASTDALHVCVGTWLPGWGQADLSLLVVLMLLLPCQLRGFTQISSLCAPSSAAILLAIAIALLDFSLQPSSPHSAPMASAEPPAEVSGPPAMRLSSYGHLASSYGHLASFIFAYQGQSMFLEMMSEMREPAEFSRVLDLAYSLMCSAYLLTVTVAFGMQGGAVASFLPDGMAEGPLKRLVGGCVLFHVLVAYVITGQPLYRYITSSLSPATLDKVSLTGRAHWLAITCAYLTFGYLVTNTLPFFAEVQELVGALSGAPIIFAWPAYFYCASCYQRASSLRATMKMIGVVDIALCALFLLVFTPIFTIFGTMGALASILTKIRNSVSI